MTPAELEAYLRERIPLSRALAVATPPGEEQWARLAAALARGPPARVTASVALECEGTGVGRLDGEFVVLPPA